MLQIARSETFAEEKITITLLVHLHKEDIFFKFYTIAGFFSSVEYFLRARFILRSKSNLKTWVITENKGSIKLRILNHQMKDSIEPNGLHCPQPTFRHPHYKL